MNLKGSHLIETLRENSGLDQDFFDTQMGEILSKYSLKPETLEIEQLRSLLADYLQTLILAEEGGSSQTESA